MKRRWRLWLVLLTLLISATVLVMPSVHWRLIGWVMRQEFYAGRPTSWWESEIEEHFIAVRIVEPRVSGMPPPSERGEIWDWFCQEQNSLWERISQQFAFSAPSIIAIEAGPSPLVLGDPEALPVLLELCNSRHPKVRAVAVFGLGAQRSAVLDLSDIIQKASQDPDEDVRSSATRAMTRLSQESATNR